MSRMTLIGAADTSSDLYTLSIGRFRSKTYNITIFAIKKEGKKDKKYAQL